MSSSSEELDDISFVDYVESLRIPYEEIELATNNFTDANLLPIHSPSSSSFPKLNYKGQLQQSDGQLIDIVARKIPEEQDNIVFNELLTSYLLTHKNILPIFKISGTDDPIIINKYEVNESLDKHLSDSNLTWMQRLHICVGVAHVLSYIHDYDAEGDFSVIHGNVKSSKILLDENWEPKLNCFGFSMFVKKHQPHLASKYSGTLQYTDPAYVNTGCLTHKSDVFSFGVVLFEVLFGRIASVENGDNWYFARLARLIYADKILGAMIDADLLKQMNLQSLEIFSETAYYCLEEESSRRPNIAQIVEKLDASLELQQNHESLMNFESNTDDAPMIANIIVDHAPTAPETEIMSSLAHLRVPLQNILSATNNFDEFVWRRRDVGGNRNDKDVLEGLQPAANVKSLEIEEFSGDSFPEWAMKMKIKTERNWIPLAKLVKIKLADCPNCLNIPMLEDLPLLQDLSLLYLDKVTCLSSSSDQRKPLSPSLRSLKLYGMKNLEKWTHAAVNSSTMLSLVLEKLEIGNCPKIILLDESLQHPLKYLKIEDCENLESVRSIQGLTSLQSLDINECPSLLETPDVHNQRCSLKDLIVKDCNKLTCLPGGFDSLALLNKLEIGPFSEELHSFPSLSGIEKLGNNLHTLWLRGWEHWESIPEEIKHLTTLRTLIIWGFGVRELSMWLTNMSSIREIRFYECRGLNEESVLQGLPREATHVYLNSEWIRLK